MAAGYLKRVGSAAALEDTAVIQRPRRRSVCIVDEKERVKNTDPNYIIQRTRGKHTDAEGRAGQHALCIGVGRHCLALGDYQWTADRRTDEVRVRRVVTFRRLD